MTTHRTHPLRRIPLRGLWAGLLAAILFLSGCGSGTGSGSGSGSRENPDGGPANRTTVSAANGRIDVPVTDNDIWALDVFTALNLMAVGAVPDHAARTHKGQEAREEVAAAAGVEIVEAHQPELVAAAGPALIVGIDHPDHRALLEQLEEIAPVVLIKDGSGIETQTKLIGAMTGHTAEAAEAVRRIDAASTALAARIDDAGRAGQTVSVLQKYPTVFYAYDSGTQLSALLTQLGLSRPKAQSGTSAWGFIEVSEEKLEHHRADIMIALVDRIYSKGQSVLDNPLLDTSGATTAEVEFSGWYSDDLLGVWWILHDVEAVLIDRTPPATFDDVPALWSRAAQVP
ncbi:ABC transporter substrate-binding protein [Streptomyces sp. NPDC055078]